MVDASGTNCLRMGSSIGSDQSATLRICGVKRTAMGACFMPSSTSKRNSSRFVGALGLLSRRDAGMLAGSTAERKLSSLLFRSTVLATFLISALTTHGNRFSSNTYLPPVAREIRFRHVFPCFDPPPVRIFIEIGRRRGVAGFQRLAVTVILPPRLRLYVVYNGPTLLRRADSIVLDDPLAALSAVTVEGRWD